MSLVQASTIRDKQLWQIFEPNMVHCGTQWQVGLNVSPFVLSPDKKFIFRGGFRLTTLDRLLDNYNQYVASLPNWYVGRVSLPDDMTDDHDIWQFSNHHWKSDSVVLTDVTRVKDMPTRDYYYMVMGFCCLAEDIEPYDEAKHDDLWYRAIERNRSLGEYLMNTTYHLAHRLVVLDGMMLRYLELKNLKLCKKAVKQDSRAVFFVPQHLSKVILDVLKTDGFRLGWVDPKIMTKEMVDVAVAQDKDAAMFANRDLIKDADRRLTAFHKIRLCDGTSLRSQLEFLFMERLCQKYNCKRRKETSVVVSEIGKHLHPIEIKQYTKVKVSRVVS